MLAECTRQRYRRNSASVVSCRGKAFGQLARGESIVTAAGATVTPDLCMEAPVPGEVVLVVDCPTPAYTAAFAAAAACLAAGAAGASESAEKLQLAVHLSPQSVVVTEQYQQAIHSMRAWRHVFADTAFDASSCCPSLASSHHLQVLA